MPWREAYRYPVQGLPWFRADEVVVVMTQTQTAGMWVSLATAFESLGASLQEATRAFEVFGTALSLKEVVK